MILSASRDSTAISWQKSSSHPNFTPETVIRASTRYVNAVAYISPTPDAPKGTLSFVIKDNRFVLTVRCRLCCNRWPGCYHQCVFSVLVEGRPRFFSSGSFRECLCVGRYARRYDSIWFLGSVSLEPSDTRSFEVLYDESVVPLEFGRTLVWRMN